MEPTTSIAERAASWRAHFEPALLVERGGLIEAIHCGAVAVVAPDGNRIASLGDPDAIYYLRSSAKPLQVLPLIESGAADHFGFTPRQLAVMAGSHSGSDEHVAVVASILERIGLDEGALACGVQTPLGREETLALDLRGEKPRQIHNNCSGKHAAMLALARFRGYSIEGYYRPAHPAQGEIIATLAGLADWPAEQIVVGVDGCGVPVFGLPLRASALTFARLANPAGLSAPRQSACRRVVAAMQAHPVMVSGHGRICTVLLTTLAGKIVAKGGAEGFYTFGVLPGVLAGAPAGLGVALKLEDGESRRGVTLLTLEVIRQLGLADDAAWATLLRHFPYAVKNLRGEDVGRVEPAFQW